VEWEIWSPFLPRPNPREFADVLALGTVNPQGKKVLGGEMTGERLSTPAGRIAKPRSTTGVGAALVGGILLAYACIGYGLYALLSAIL
jgi:hypothetical protein